jgi:acyl carrier protein phosphodiesterase
LAKNWRNYSEIPLPIYADNVYSFFQDNIEIFPTEIQKLLPFMIEHNWLVTYASLEGIKKVLIGMNKRTKGISKMDLAIGDLVQHYEEFESDFTVFFKDLVQFSDEKTINLLSR